MVANDDNITKFRILAGIKVEGEEGEGGRRGYLLQHHLRNYIKVGKVSKRKTR